MTANPGCRSCGGTHWIQLKGGVPVIAFRDLDIQRPNAAEWAISPVWHPAWPGWPSTLSRQLRLEALRRLCASEHNPVILINSHQKKAGYIDSADWFVELPSSTTPNYQFPYRSDTAEWPHGT